MDGVRAAADAVADGDVAALRALVDAGLELDVVGEDGMTPLHCAGFVGNAQVCRLLLAAGASPTLPAWDTPGATALNFALFYGQTEAAEVLAGAGVAPDDLRTRAALGHVTEMSRFIVGDGALASGADAGMAFCRPGPFFPPREGSWNDQTVLDESLTWAARNGRIEAMEALVAAGADVNANPYRGTALLWATYSDLGEVARWLLDRGADPDLRHDFGGAEHGGDAVAMHLAAQYGSLEVLRVLLEADADATVVDGLHGATPLGWAEHGGSDDAAAMLREHLAR